MNDIIRMTDVEIGDNPYHLIFTGFISRKDPNKKYEFDFTGTDIVINGTYLSEKAKEELCKKLLKDFGYPPYDIDEVKIKFGKIKEYKINLFS